MTARAHGMVLTTLPSEEDARRMADLLVAERLAGCVQMMPITSVYRWQGAPTCASECLLLIKTRAVLFDRVMERIRQIHPYRVPEIVAMPFTAGLPAYLDWIDAETAENDSVSSSRSPEP